MLTLLTIDTVCLIIRIARFGFTPPTGALEVVLIFITVSVTFVALILPMITKRVKERNEEINGINYARETRPKLIDKMNALQKEKEAYLKEFGQIDGSQ